jgi:AraC family transcriptional regulator
MKLPEGVFLGRRQQTWERQGFVLTLSVYEPKRELPWHAHANPSLFLVLRGEHRDRARDGDYDQPELGLVFHPTTEPHAGVIGPRGALGLNIEYTSLWLERHEVREQDLGGLRPLDSVSTRLQVLQFLGAVFQDGPPAAAESENHAVELLEPLVALKTQAALGPRPRWFRRAEDYIREEFRSPITLRACARAAGIHPVHLARVFRQRYGCSVSEYLRALRLLEAGRLILHDNVSIAQAAHRAGFADHAHFTRSCSRQFGFTPRVLRLARRNLHF